MAIDQSELRTVARKVRAKTTTYLGVRLLVSALWVNAGLAAAGGSFATFIGARALAGSQGFTVLVPAVFAGAIAASPFLVAIAILHLLMAIADGVSTEAPDGSTHRH